MTKNIRTQPDEIRRYLDDIKARMHPGDYADTLANIVHFTFVEAGRLSDELNSKDPLRGVFREVVEIGKVRRGYFAFIDIEALAAAETGIAG